MDNPTSPDRFSSEQITNLLLVSYYNYNQLFPFFPTIHDVHQFRSIETVVSDKIGNV